MIYFNHIITAITKRLGNTVGTDLNLNSTAVQDC